MKRGPRNRGQIAVSLIGICHPNRFGALGRNMSTGLAILKRVRHRPATRAQFPFHRVVGRGSGRRRNRERARVDRRPRAPGEPARVVRNLEIRPRPGPAGVQFLKRLPGEL